MYRSPVWMMLLAVAVAGALRSGRSTDPPLRGRLVVRPEGMLIGMSTGNSTGRSTRNPMRGMSTDSVRPV
jgi:hypothetical protein